MVNRRALGIMEVPSLTRVAILWNKEGGGDAAVHQRANEVIE